SCSTSRAAPVNQGEASEAGVGGGGWGEHPCLCPLCVGFSRISKLSEYDEDRDLAHEFYEETIVTKNGQKRAKLRRVHKNLIPQGFVKLDPPRLHVDFPVILYEV
uniref:Tumor suppressor candidate 2 n=1 Tax=Urocitellus parryii TaxID=9999 RepID=A0A8D2GNT5_UROPR